MFYLCLFLFTHVCLSVFHSLCRSLYLAFSDVTFFQSPSLFFCFPLLLSFLLPAVIPPLSRSISSHLLLSFLPSPASFVPSLALFSPSPALFPPSCYFSFLSLYFCVCLVSVCFYLCASLSHTLHPSSVVTLFCSPLSLSLSLYPFPYPYPWPAPLFLPTCPYQCLMVLSISVCFPSCSQDAVYLNN